MLLLMPINNANDIAHIIQLSVAPVFLIAAVNTLLVVLTSRLARVVDRGRILDNEIKNAAAPHANPNRHLDELRALDQRMNWIHWSITLATLAVLLVAMVILTLFAGEMLDLDLSQLISAFFIAAMVFLIAGLLAFLQEISHARKLLRVRPELLQSRAPRN
jgi:pheromone shutdown protein TraB